MPDSRSWARSAATSRLKFNSRAKRPQPFWQRQWRYFYLRFVRLQGTSAAIARGIAVGVFAGMFPIFGFQILASVLLATWVRGNKLAAAAATWVSNPFTYVPLFAFNYQVGQRLLGLEQIPLAKLEVMFSGEILRLGTGLAAALFFGCLVVGLVAAPVSYFLSYGLIHALHQRYPRRSKSRR